MNWPGSRCRAIGTIIYTVNHPIKHKYGGDNFILKRKTGSSHGSRSTLIYGLSRGGLRGCPMLQGALDLHI